MALETGRLISCLIERTQRHGYKDVSLRFLGQKLCRFDSTSTKVWSDQRNRRRQATDALKDEKDGTQSAKCTSH